MLSKIGIAFLLSMRKILKNTQSLLGFQSGSECDEMGQDVVGIGVWSWNSCGSLEFPDDTWPASGGGNTITYVDCQQDPSIVAGYFHLTAYTPSIMSIMGFSPHHTQEVKVATCLGVEASPDLTVGMDRVGWISMGGAAKGTDTDGCNPALEPCDQDPTPVRSTTWGRIKTKFGN